MGWQQRLKTAENAQNAKIRGRFLVFWGPAPIFVNQKKIPATSCVNFFDASGSKEADFWGGALYHN